MGLYVGMMKSVNLLFLMVAILCVPVLGQVTPDDNEDDDRVADTSGSRRFWKANLPGGKYMVALDRLSNVSIHEYVLDGNLIVNEVTVDTTGRALARFYHIRPVTDDMKRGGIPRVVDRGKELIDRAGQKAGTDIHEMAQKNYPTTTHAGMVEYRILHLQDLDALYGSITAAWESGRGRNFTIK